MLTRKAVAQRNRDHDSNPQKESPLFDGSKIKLVQAQFSLGMQRRICIFRVSSLVRAFLKLLQRRLSVTLSFGRGFGNLLRRVDGRNQILLQVIAVKFFVVRNASALEQQYFIGDIKDDTYKELAGTF